MKWMLIALINTSLANLDAGTPITLTPVKTELVFDTVADCRKAGLDASNAGFAEAERTTPAHRKGKPKDIAERMATLMIAHTYACIPHAPRIVSN